MKIGGKTLCFTAGLFLGVLSTSGLFLSDQLKTRIAQASVLTRQTSQMIMAGLAFDDVPATTHVLNSLEGDKSVVFGAVYDAGGNLFASYCRDCVDTQGLDTGRASETGFSLCKGYMKIAEPVVLDDEKIGMLCIYYKL